MKKQWYKKTWIWVIVAFVLLIGFCSPPRNETGDSITTEPTCATIEVVESIETTATTNLSQIPNETLISTINNIMSRFYEEDKYKVYVENDKIYVDIWEYGLTDELSTLLIKNNLSPWNELVSASEYMCDEIWSLAKTMGSNYSVVLTIYDKTKNIPMLGVVNGLTFYNIVEEISK